MYKVINIFWERTNLHIVVDKKIASDIFIEKENLKILLNTVNDNELVLSITNTLEGQMLDEGKWVLSSVDGITIDENIVSKLQDKSRNFTYREEKYAYLVNFSIDSDLKLIIKTIFMMVNLKPKKFYRFSETILLTEKIKILVNKLGIFGINLIYKFIHSLRLNNKKVLFMTENSEILSGNLKSIYDYLKDNSNYRITVYTTGVRVKKTSILKLLKETIILASHDIVFLDNYTSILTHLKISKDTKVVQLWHAGIGFKSVGYARFGLQSSPHPYQSCHRKYTDVIVDNDKLIDIYQEVFGCDKKIIYPLGIPRIDGYLNLEKIEKACEKLYDMNKELKEKKVILFAPTYRGKDMPSAYYDMSKINFDEISEFCKDNNFVFIIKLHPFIKQKIEIPTDYNGIIYNYSDLDINELIYISDIMITDYSSCAYEFSLFNRPLIFYRYDKIIYEYLRPMHTVNIFSEKQYEVQTFEELMKMLKEFKGIKKDELFKDISMIRKCNSCEEITKKVLGE